MDRLEEEIIEMAGEEINVDSPQQISTLLFEKRGLSPMKSTQTPGQFSTDKDVLTELLGEDPIIEKLLHRRELSTLLGTFIGKLPVLVDPQSGRIHPQWMQTRL